MAVIPKLLMKNKVAFVIRKQAGLPCSCPPRPPSPQQAPGRTMPLATNRMPTANTATPCCRGSGNSYLGVSLVWVSSCANIVVLKHLMRVPKPSGRDC